MDANQTIDHQHVCRPIRQFLHLTFPHTIWDRAEEMVGRFCEDGQVAVATLLRQANSAGKFYQALEMLDFAWREHFNYQHPEMRGRPDLADNGIRYSAIYRTLGIPMPGHEERE